VQRVTLDLGVINHPLIVFGGPYGNLEAVTALIAEADRRGVPGDHMICTGDLAAYCADAQATADLLRERGVVVVAGNVEESLSAGVGNCGCGFNEGSACDVLASSWYAHADRTIDYDTKHWMGSLPNIATFTMSGARIAVVHGGVAQTNKFIFPATPDEILRHELRVSGADGVIAGHSGIPFTRLIDGQIWHNAGAIGMPANDGTPHVWYSVVTPDADSISFEIRALDYDWRGAVAKMRAAGLPLAYADALETGMWPSDDIAPPDDRAQRGRPLAESVLQWSIEGLTREPMNQRIAAP
jgi:predicted phosphodiesterase